MWGLSNSFKGWTLYDLNVREVQLLVNSVPVNEIKFLSICELINKKWHSLDVDNYPQFFSETGKKQGEFPDLVFDSTLDTEADYFIVKPKKIILPRLYDRVEIELDASIDGHNQSFHSKTIDLSEGGIYFKDLIPDWVSGYFIVSIHFQNLKCQIMCSLVEDQKLRHRVQVVSEESDFHYLAYKKLLNQIRSSQG
jgi:hypothetical protein